MNTQISLNIKTTISVFCENLFFFSAKICEKEKIGFG